MFLHTAKQYSVWAVLEDTENRDDWYASADCQRLSAKLYRLAGEIQSKIEK